MARTVDVTPERWMHRGEALVSVRGLRPLLVWGGISFGIYTVGLALLGQRFRGGDIARANAAFTILYTIGGLVGRPVAGKAMDLVGTDGFGPSIAVFYLVAGLGALLALRRSG